MNVQPLPYLFNRVHEGVVGVELVSNDQHQVRVFHGDGSSEIFVYSLGRRVELVGYSCVSSDREFYNDLQEFCDDFQISLHSSSSIPVLE